MGSELKVEKKISLTVRFRLVDQSAKDMQLETADWDGALLTEATVQYTGDSCPMGAVNMLDSIEAAFAEKYPDLQEQYVLLPEMRSADPWSKVYRLNDGKSCFAATENYVYLSREGDVVFPLTDDSTLVAEFPVYVYRYGEQDGRITYRVRINNARPEYFTPSLTLRSGAVASFTFDEERGEWVTQLKRSDFGADERDIIHLTGLRGEKTNAFLTVTGREERRIVTLTWTADTQRTTIDAQNVLWDSDRAAEGNDLLCCAGELVSVTMQPAAGYRGIHASLSDPAVSLSISEGNDAASFLMPYAPLTLTLTADKLYTVTLDASGGDPIRPIQYTVESEAFLLPTPVRTGYTFLGWTGEGIVNPQTEVIIPTGSTGNKAYTANWEATVYTIMLKNLPNGNETIPYTVEQEVKLPYPEKGGYFFEGWSGTGMTGQEYYVTIPEGTTGNREYTAHWKPTTYEIAFLMNGGEPLASIFYTVESPDFDLPIPVRNGYKFVGWTSDGITVPQEIVTIHQGSMGFRMYTAQWQEQLVEPTVVPPPTIRVYCRDVDSKELLHIAVYTPSVGSEDFTLNFDSIDVTGRKFVEAHDASGNKLTSITIPQGSWGSREYDAYFAKETYTITLDTNGGPAMSPINYTVTDSVTLRIPPDRPGYEFSGWVLDGSGQFPSTPMIIPAGSTGDRIYKAEWRVASYTITYVSHGKAYNWVQYTINNQVYFGTPEEDPSYYLPGYTFVGWKIDGVEGTPRSYMLPKGSYGNRTATMLWEAIP